MRCPKPLVESQTTHATWHSKQLRGHSNHLHTQTEAKCFLGSPPVCLPHRCILPLMFNVQQQQNNNNNTNNGIKRQHDAVCIHNPCS
jgi:hypothetical protein